MFSTHKINPKVKDNLWVMLRPKEGNLKVTLEGDRYC